MVPSSNHRCGEPMIEVPPCSELETLLLFAIERELGAVEASAMDMEACGSLWSQCQFI